MFGAPKPEPDARLPVFMMGHLSPLGEKNSKLSIDFGKNVGHVEPLQMLGMEPRKRPIYPRVDYRDISNAYNASSLSQKPPSLVDMARDSERKVTRVYNGQLNPAYLREVAREKRKGNLSFCDHIPNSLKS